MSAVPFAELHPAAIGKRVAALRTKYESLLLALFIVSLPLVNPWIRGDGVGYYAFARALLIDHNLDFREDWLRANPSFRMGRTDGAGNLIVENYTATGHVDNHFSVGPAILWSPFLVVTHVAVLTYDRLGGRVAADGYSLPYVAAVAIATAIYGFLALLLSFALARRYLTDWCAFLATVGVWWASSLPVYMYFNPSWSHADSAFVVALFLWYWLRTRNRRWPRSQVQWLVLGALAGLMIDVYYVNAALLLFPILESLGSRRPLFAETPKAPIRCLAVSAALFLAGLGVMLLPTLVTKKIIYGSFWSLGYHEPWFWNSPAFLKVCFSADHGLFTWTPILILAVAGLWALRRYDRQLAAYSIAVFLGFLYIIGCYHDWHGISSYGSRFFVGLTPLFVLGLAALFDRIVRATKQERPAAVLVSGVTAALILWNLGLVFQWGMHLIPERGSISWPVAVRNQLTVVPEGVVSGIKAYVTRRKDLMDSIEQRDVIQIQSDSTRERTNP